MILTKVLEFFTEYLKGKPITDVLLIVLIGQAIWVESVRRGATDKAHDMVRTVIKDIRTENDDNMRAAREEARDNADRLVSVLTDIKRVAKQTAVNTAEVSAKLPEVGDAKKVDDK